MKRGCIKYLYCLSNFSMIVSVRCDLVMGWMDSIDILYVEDVTGVIILYEIYETSFSLSSFHKFHMKWPGVQGCKILFIIWPFKWDYHEIQIKVNFDYNCGPFQFNNVQVGPSMSYWHASCFVIIFVADLLNWDCCFINFHQNKYMLQ